VSHLDPPFWVHGMTRPEAWLAYEPPHASEALAFIDLGGLTDEQEPSRSPGLRARVLARIRQWWRR